jgi:hypothetical protein
MLSSRHTPSAIPPVVRSIRESGLRFASSFPLIQSCDNRASSTRLFTRYESLGEEYHRPPSAYVWLQSRDFFGGGLASFCEATYKRIQKEKHAAQGSCARLTAVRAIGPKVSISPDRFGYTQTHDGGHPSQVAYSTHTRRDEIARLRNPSRL